MTEDDSYKKELEQRLAKLEKKMASLEEKIRQPDRTGAPGDSNNEEAPAGEDRPLEGEPKQETADRWDDFAQFGEKWLNRIGIGLLLLGVAFLFKYSIDQGWLTPPIRSLIGLGIGLVLFGLGLRMDRDKKPLKQILSGGGIAAFYITGFATFQLYRFAPREMVWIFMIIVTLLALVMSLRQNEAVLSVTGTAGALGTPYMLYTGSGSLSALMMYTGLVLGATGYIYLQKGWRSLLWSMTLGGWTVVLVGMAGSLMEEPGPALADRWSLQAGILFCMMVFWGVPVAREILSFHNPGRWPDPVFVEDATRDEKGIYLLDTSPHLLALMVPVVSLFLSMGVWEFARETWGWIAMAASAGVAGCYLALRRRSSMPKMASVHGFSALALLTIGFVLLLEGNLLFLVLAVEAAGLRYVAGETGDTPISASSHVLFGIVGCWLIALMAWEPVGEHSPDVNAFVRMAIIGIGGIAVPLWLQDRTAKRIYGIAAHLFFLGWLYRQLLPLDESHAWITVAWGLYAILLLVAGVVRLGRFLRLTGMATIFLVVGKLLLVDLAQLQAIWRILLFFGFGSVFLVLAYYWQLQWNHDKAAGQDGWRTGGG